MGNPNKAALCLFVVSDSICHFDSTGCKIGRRKDPAHALVVLVSSILHFTLSPSPEYLHILQWHQIGCNVLAELLFFFWFVCFLALVQLQSSCLKIKAQIYVTV